VAPQRSAGALTEHLLWLTCLRVLWAGLTQQWTVSEILDRDSHAVILESREHVFGEPGIGTVIVVPAAACDVVVDAPRLRNSQYVPFEHGLSIPKLAATRVASRVLPSPESYVPQSTREQHTFAQEVEGAAAVHLAFDQFEPVDIAFDRTGAPVHCEASMHRQAIVVEIPTKSAQLRRTGALNFSNPAFELRPTSLADQHHETLC
jgi:hypothetical protein